MSDLRDFQSMKDAYAKDPANTTRLGLTLYDEVRADQALRTRYLPSDATNGALFDLAAADRKADHGDGQAAQYFQHDALNYLSIAQKAGADVKGLQQIADHVGRKIPK